ncbi:MAG: B12-binding domain-containing radical SAM protein [Syntrophales bacterium]|nr:B12-binding domain-containing radical SAM protein [Syntrophales bacterium]MDD5640245.1 B12-binding domain-containing radical SAM protein [Syntrophales bacterium]
MRALLVCPEFPLSFWSFRKSCQLLGSKTVNPPLGLLTVAALLPPSWELRLADLNTRSLTEDDWQWADLILISAMYIQRAGLLDLVREAKGRGKTVVAGGPHPTSLPGAVLEAGCDFVVRGEGENTIPLLLKALKLGKTGIIENDEKPDMATSPIPRFDLLQLDDYVAFSIQTSRGCPFDCEFCDVVNLFGRLPRYKTPKQVIAELEALHRLGVRSPVFICDDNFIGSKKQARTLLQNIIAWSRSRGGPFRFLTQASVNLGQDPEMIDLMLTANLREVFIGIESPDENVLQASHKYQNIKNPLLESLGNLKKKGMEVMGSFIIGLDGEKKGAGERICAFIEQADIPVSMLGVLQAAPYTRLWYRLEEEGRLRPDVGDDAGTFSAMNLEPDRPEAEIMQEYADAWDYLYEPSRYLARTYRYYLAMQPAHRNQAEDSQGTSPTPRDPGRRMTWRQLLVGIKAFFKILWWQGLRPTYRRQVWTQLLGMLRQNPTRFEQYFATCVQGEDLFDLRKVVREKAKAIIKGL